MGTNIQLFISFKNNINKNQNQSGLKTKPDVSFSGHLKQLKRDVISFKSRVESPATDPVYKKINDIADMYFSRLKEGVQGGLNFLQEQVKNLQVNWVNSDDAAGRARIISDPQSKDGIKYEIDLNEGTSSIFDAVLHEGYHILQFEHDSNAEFVSRQKMLTRNEAINPELKETYERLTEIVVQEIVLPNYHKKRNEVIQNIIKAMSTSDHKSIEYFQKGIILNPQEKILPEGLNNWIKRLSDNRMLKYIASHAEVEIKAHTYCMEKNDLSIIYNRNDINMSKIRDIIAIQIYQEIKEMAQKELLRREKSELIDLKLA